MTRIINILIVLSLVMHLQAQDAERPSIKGNLSTESIQIEPIAGQLPSYITVVKVLLSLKNIYLGVRCYDDEPDKIVDFSKARDADPDDEVYLGACSASSKTSHFSTWF
jgi:hypothetical protein